MAMTKNSIVTIKRKIARLEKGMAESKRQCAELQKTLVLRFAEENQKRVDAFRDGIAKEQIELDATDVKALLEFIRNRKKKAAAEQAADARKNKKAPDAHPDDSDKKSEKMAAPQNGEHPNKDEKIPEGQNEVPPKKSEDGQNPPAEKKTEDGKSEKLEDVDKSQKDGPVETMVADVSVSSPNGVVNPDEQKNNGNGELIQMWSPDDNNVF